MTYMTYMTYIPYSKGKKLHCCAASKLVDILIEVCIISAGFYRNRKIEQI